MSIYKSCQTYEMLEEKLKTYLTKDDLDFVYKAYEFAYNKHFGQKRLTGEDYITHLLTVAYILTKISADAVTIASALLHDIFETNTTKEEIKNEFGDEVLSLVEGVSKINKLNLSGDSESVITSQRKILVGLSEDVRVIIIKLADRLHNMKTLYVFDDERQKQTAKETLDILTPIAHRLGMNTIKSELEELALRYLKPDEYYAIVEKLNATKAERDQSVARMIESVSEILNKHNIKHEIKGRSKSIYSIYKKLDGGKRFHEIYDLLALRVFVNTEEECYQALGIIHSKFKPKPNRFKDYIAMPKTNMYQSLHTTVFGVDGQLFEIQIRTYEMDKIAENGIASHWSYKEKGSGKAAIQSDMEQKLQFFKSIMELRQGEETDEEFVTSVKEDILKNIIYVFTPMGDVIELPYGATPIDFAYKVHTKVGDSMTGALVNNQMVSLEHTLENNDVVKIITNNNSLGPSREWLNIAKTTQAKNKIKNFFSKADKDENIKNGEDLLNRELRRRKIIISEFLNDDNIEKVLTTLKLGSLNELYSNIGSDKISAENAVEAAYKEELSKEAKLLEKASKLAKVTDKEGVITVAGIEDIKINIAACCKPIPGDRVVGYITKGNGINVHRISCPNVSGLEERLIEVKWNNTNEKFLSTLLIHAKEGNDVLLQIIAKAANSDIGVQNINSTKNLDNQIIEMTVVVKDKEELQKLISNIKMIDLVIDIERHVI